jgi:hypothetical protein
LKKFVDNLEETYERLHTVLSKATPPPPKKWNYLIFRLDLLNKKKNFYNFSRIII